MSFEEAAYKIGEEIAELVIKKQRDYGKDNILNSPFGPETLITLRIHEKTQRLANLIKTQQQPSNESIEDSWDDIIGYAFVGKMLQNDTFKLPLK